MTSHAQLARNFADGATKGSAHNMFIEGDTIFSYGRHFPVARRYEGGYLFNSNGYSTSTAKHKSYVWRTLGPRVIEIAGCNIDNAKSQLEANERKMATLKEKYTRARLEWSKDSITHGIASLHVQQSWLALMASGEFTEASW